MTLFHMRFWTYLADRLDPGMLLLLLLLHRPLAESEFQKGSVGELSALESFRVRILPCLGEIMLFMNSG